MAPINRGFLTAGLLTVVGTAIVAFVYVGNDNSLQRRLEVLRRRRHRPRPRPGAQPAHRVLHLAPRPRRSGRSPRRPAPARPPSCSPASSSGLESSVYAIIGIAIALGVGIGLGDGNIQFTFYLVALTGMGMLATTGVVVSEDTFGPVADNAAGIAEMSGEFEGEPERIMVSLDAVGNTTKAVTKGFAIGSAVIAVGRAVRLVHRDDRRRARPASRASPATGCSTTSLTADQRRRPEDVHRPAHRWLDRVPVLGARHPRRRPHRRRRRAGGPQPVRRRQDHGGHQEARLRPGHRHLHRGVAARARHAGAARRAHAGHHRLRHQLSRPRRVPRRRHPHRPAHGQLPVATPVARGTTPRSTSRTATRAARAPRRTRRPSSATPSATRSRTPPARRSTRSSR